MRRILLICKEPPGTFGVGPVILKTLCDAVGPEHFVVGSLAEKQGDGDGYNVYHFPLKDRAPGCSSGKLRKTVSQGFYYQVILPQKARGVAARLKDVIDREKIDVVWSVLSAPSVYAVTPLVIRQSRRPLVTTVWDPPEGVGLALGLGRAGRAVIQNAFDRAIRAACRCAVISENMAHEYTERYGVATRVVRVGVDIAKPADTACTEGIPDRAVGSDSGEDHVLGENREWSQGSSYDDRIRIGFCGSLYALSEWRSFLRALEECKWRIADRPVSLSVIGSRLPPLRSRYPADIIFYGWRSHEEAQRILSRCHIAYFPYWFHPAYAESVRLCFGTKITTYLAAGVPLLYHGPQESAVVKFCNRFHLAECVHSNDPSAIRDALEKMASSTSQKEMRSEIHRAIAEELNFANMSSRQHWLLFGQEETLRGTHEPVARLRRDATAVSER